MCVFGILFFHKAGNYFLVEKNQQIMKTLKEFKEMLLSCHLQSHSIHVQRRALLPSDVTDFALLPSQRLFTGNSFIVRGCAVGKDL